MSIKRTNTANGGGDTAELPANQESQVPGFREKATVNAKIDAYIKNNPKEWACVQGMPRDRLERTLILQSVQKVERQEKMRANVLKKLDENPEPREAFRNLVKNLLAEQQEKAMVTHRHAFDARNCATSAEADGRGARLDTRFPLSRRLRPCSKRFAASPRSRRLRSPRTSARRCQSSHVLTAETEVSTPLPDAAPAGETVTSASPHTDSRTGWPTANHLRRSLLRSRPPATTCRLSCGLPLRCGASPMNRQ